MQRVKLTFDRNQDGLTEQYLVYRALGSGNSELAMSIQHPSQPNPLFVQDEAPRVINGHYYTRHGNLLLDRGFTVKINGAAVEDVWVDEVTGHIQFAVSPSPTDLVEISYWFDGVEVVDTSRPQEGVARFIPPAVDRTPPLPVRNVQLTPAPETGEVVLSWEPPPPTSGTTYRYSVVAADTHGNRSLPSAEVVVVLNQSLGEVPYVVERSTDGGLNFEVAGETKELVWRDMVSFDAPPSPPVELAALVEPASGEKPAAVVLTWAPGPASGGLSNVYRIRTRSALDAYSDPSEMVGPVEVEQQVAYYLVERYAGDQLELTVTIPETTYRDTAILDFTTYTYRIYSMDPGGRQSGAAEIVVETGDISPPDAPEILGTEVEEW